MQEPVAWGLIADGEVADCISPSEHAKCEGEYTIPLYITPPTAAQAARQMRDAAVKVLRELEELCKDGSCGYVASEAIAALPLPGEEKCHQQ